MTFLVPLGLLAWVGGEELRRQSERAENAQDLQSLTFLRAARDRLEPYVDRIVSELLPEPTLGLVDLNPVLAVRQLSEAVGPELRDIFLLDDQGQMIFPQPPPTDLGLPLHASPRAGAQSPGPSRSGAQTGPGADALFAAEILHARGQLEQAQELLEQFLAGQNGAPPSRQEQRAQMQLATILRERGFRQEAMIVYEVLIGTLDRWWALWVDEEDSAFPDAALSLVASVGAAEVEDNVEERLDLMFAISEGIYDDVADGMLGAVMERLLDGIPAESSSLRNAALDAFNTNRFRFDGRQFAARYESLLAETMRRNLRQPTDDVIYEVFTDDDGSWLLALRETSFDEEFQTGATWVGIRLDLALLLLNEGMDPFLVPDEAGFTLAIRDTDGRPVMPATEPSAALEGSSLPTAFGLQLWAIPGDPEAFLAANRASVRNRALLIVFLVLVAGGGAVFLWRSVARESELAQLKVDLVSRVSHELKTPLSLIRLYGETLAMGRTRDRDQVTHFSGVITRESERLSNMIGRILDFSRQQAGTLEYDRHPVEIGSLVSAVIEAYRPHVEAQGASLEIDLARDLVADVDSDAMEAAVLNLLENAVKYTPSDAPDRAVRVELRRDNGSAVLNVMDRGVGIPREEQERVFESFYRASNASEARGAGLGLSLVHHFVEAHGGTIEITARSGGGTIVRLSLPVADKRESDGKPN